LTAILLTAVLTLVGLTQPVRLPDLLRGTPNTVTLAEQSTGYDLSEITDWNKRAIILLPGLTYYPSTLLTPEPADSAAPVSTDKFAALRAEYLVLNLPDTNEACTLAFKLSVRHAMRVYVNGAPAGETGRVGTTRQDTEVWENNITVSASPANGKMDVLLSSAQSFTTPGTARILRRYL